VSSPAPDAPGSADGRADVGREIVTRRRHGFAAVRSLLRAPHPGAADPAADVIDLRSPVRTSPDFILVGAARSGTTTMYQWLSEHPGVFMPQTKEPSYFVFGFGMTDSAEYRSLFAPAGPRLTGEASASYLAPPETPSWIRQTVGDARILVLLREPTARAFSLYCWMRQNGWEPIADFEKALAEEDIRARAPQPLQRYRQHIWDYLYFRSGLYASQIKAYQSRFSSVKVLLLEDLAARPQESFDEVCDFLGIAHLAIQPGTSNESRQPKSLPLQLALSRAMTWRQAARPSNPGYIEKALWRATQLNLTSDQTPRLDPAVEAALRPRYREDILRTADLIGRDLTPWLEGRQVSSRT
jgi:hypothetical protein